MLEKDLIFVAVYSEQFLEKKMRKKERNTEKEKTSLISRGGGLTTAEAAAYIGVSEQWLRMSRMKNPAWPGPRYIKVSPRIIIYRTRHLDEFLAARVEDPADRFVAA